MEMLTLTWDNVAFLLIVGLIGGLVSGFIGSGGAFVLTSAMMNMGVTGVVAVASNICHKFKKVWSAPTCATNTARSTSSSAFTWR
jgi:hypothetical protein